MVNGKPVLRGWSRPLRRSLSWSLAGGLFLLAACTGKGFVYVASSDSRAFFKVPNNWTSFNKRDILVATGQNPSELSNQQNAFLVAFDADPAEPSLAHVVDLTTAPGFPVVYARALALSGSARDQMSLGGIRNAVYPIDELFQSDQVEVLEYNPNVVVSGGLHGSRIVYDVIVRGTSAIGVQNPVIRVNQTGLVDPETSMFYLFYVRCEVHCYTANKTLIDQVAQSWTVKER